MPETPTPESDERPASLVAYEPENTIPMLYCNSVALDRSLSDVGITFQLGASTEQMVRMPYITAKTLAVLLSSLILDFEKRMGQEIPTMADVHERHADLAAVKEEEPTT